LMQMPTIPIFDAISTPIETRITTGFMRIGTAMRSKAWELAVTHGLTPTQVDILSLLSARGVALRLTTIAEQLAITPATASDAVATLVAKGLAGKERASDDRRAIAVCLTGAGTELSAEISEGGGLLDEALQSLGVAEQTQLLAMMVKLIRHLQEHGKVASSRMCVTCQHFEANRHPDTPMPHHCRLVGAAFGNVHLRLDCAEHSEAEAATLSRNWQAFAG
jgi:DNA-binding MarR family transcriptional regulator